MAAVNFFSDVDGVLHIPNHIRVNRDGQNVIPFSKEWKHNNEYEVVELVRDPTQHYPITHSEKVVPQADWDFHWSDEMLAEIRFLINQGWIDFVWLTNWRHHAVNILNPLFNLPEHVSFLPWEITDNHDMKAPALLSFYEQTPIKNRKPFVWVDDKANVDYIPEGKFGSFFQTTFQVDALVITTDPQYGLSQQNLADIHDFVVEHQ